MKNETTETYQCDKCGDTWGFFPQDYVGVQDWPSVCPLCTMPVYQMIKDVYQEEGFLAVLRQLWLRHF